MNQMKLSEAYNILDVRPSSKLITVTKKYHQLAMASHPDRFPNDEKKKEQFTQYALAYSLIEERKKRVAHFFDTLDSLQKMVKSDIKNVIYTHTTPEFRGSVSDKLSVVDKKLSHYKQSVYDSKIPVTVYIWAKVIFESVQDSVQEYIKEKDLKKSEKN